jgi:hypothetical protein
MKIVLLIMLVLAVILGPILALRPSPRDRRLGRLRAVALKYRVKVQPLLLRNNTQFSATLERNPHLGDYGWSGYQLVAEEGQVGPSVKGQWVQRKTSEGRLVWESEDVRQKTTPLVDEVLAQWEQAQQPDFLSLELGPRSVTLVWNEKGESADAEAVCQLLQKLMTA